MKSKINVTAIIGLILALGLCFFGMISASEAQPDGGSKIIIKSEQAGNFFDIASILITVGGTIGAMVFAFPMSVLSKIPKMLGMVFHPKKFEPHKYIEEMVEYCKIARLKGILQLEESANECKDPFMKSALMLIVDANDSEKVQSMLDDAIDFMCERHDATSALWLKASGSAPAFGMIGTLVGLINMLKTMDPTDPTTAAGLGAGMATALITTFYGCIMAHALFTPIANQLKYVHNAELLCMQIVEEGALAIISGANPRYVQEKLEMMLPSGEKTDPNAAPGDKKGKKAKKAKA